MQLPGPEGGRKLGTFRRNVDISYDELNRE